MRRQIFAIGRDQSQHRTVGLGELREVAEQARGKFLQVRLRAEFGAVTKQRDQTFVARRQLGSHVGQRGFRVGEFLPELSGVGKNFCGGRRSRAVQRQNILRGGTQVKNVIRQRLHQINPASALGVRVGQFDFARPVEAGGVVGHAHFHTAFAGGNFNDHRQFLRFRPGVFHRVVAGLDERQLPRAEFGLGKIFLRQPVAHGGHGGAHGRKFARGLDAEGNPVLAAGGVHAGKSMREILKWKSRLFSAQPAAQLSRGGGGQRVERLQRDNHALGVLRFRAVFDGEKVF